MATEPKVVWSEGIFITSQHFQQFDRYIESGLRQPLVLREEFYWGFIAPELDINGLKRGVIGINAAEGVFPDGFIFSFTEKQLEAVSVKIPPNTKDIKLCLALTLPSSVSSELVFPEDIKVVGLHCFRTLEKSISGIINIELEPRQLTLADFNPALVLESDIGQGQTSLPIAVIRSCSAGSEITLDDLYTPSFLGSRQQHHLRSYISEGCGLLLQKSNSLANAVSDPNTGGSAEVVDFMMLQTINHYLAYLLHKQENVRQTHFGTLFVNLSKLCADLMAFLPSRKLNDMPIYMHNDLALCFSQLFINLRESLSIVLEQGAIRIPLDMRDDSLCVAQTPDQSLLDKASFMLAVKADISNDVLRQRIPSIVKIGTVERVKELVAYHLPGIKVRALPVAPCELPYHSGYVYFELSKKNEL